MTQSLIGWALSAQRLVDENTRLHSVGVGYNPFGINRRQKCAFIAMGGPQAHGKLKIPSTYATLPATKNLSTYCEACQLLRLRNTTDFRQFFTTFTILDLTRAGTELMLEIIP